MAERLDPDAARGLRAVIQFILSGEDGGSYAVVIADQQCTIEEGSRADADAVMTMSAQTYVDLALGHITGSQGFYSRKIKFSGNLNLVMRIHALFPSVRGDEQTALSG